MYHCILLSTHLYIPIGLYHCAIIVVVCISLFGLMPPAWMSPFLSPHCLTPAHHISRYASFMSATHTPMHPPLTSCRLQAWSWCSVILCCTRLLGFTCKCSPLAHSFLPVLCVYKMYICFLAQSSHPPSIIYFILNHLFDNLRSCVN